MQSAAAAAPHHHAHPAFRDAEDAAGGGDTGLKFRVEVGGSGFHPSTEIVHLGFGLYRAVYVVVFGFVFYKGFTVLFLLLKVHGAAAWQRAAHTCDVGR